MMEVGGDSKLSCKVMNQLHSGEGNIGTTASAEEWG